jgi:hypothetical protein
MKTHVKELYGRRITPVVRIFMLVVIIFLGLHLAFTGAGHDDQHHVETTIVE